MTSIARLSEDHGLEQGKNIISLEFGNLLENGREKNSVEKKTSVVLVLGAGRVCRPAAEFLTSIGSFSSRQLLKSCIEDDFQEKNYVEVVVASLYLKDAEEVVSTKHLMFFTRKNIHENLYTIFDHFNIKIVMQITEGISNATAVQLDVADLESLHYRVEQVETLLPHEYAVCS